MNTNHITPMSGSTDWEFPTLAYVWDYKTRAIVAGADRLEALSDDARVGSLRALSERIQTLARGLDNGWLVVTAFVMVDDLYRSYFCQFRWSPGVHDYIAATAGVFLEELAQRGFMLHYVIDSTQPEAELDEKLTFIPAVFQTAGLFVTGPQLMALELMQRLDHRPRDVAAIPPYRGRRPRDGRSADRALPSGAPVLGVSEPGPRRRHPGSFAGCGPITKQRSRHHRSFSRPAAGCRFLGQPRPTARGDSPRAWTAAIGD